MRPRMQLSFLSDCDEVALPALKLHPDTDTEMAHAEPVGTEREWRDASRDAGTCISGQDAGGTCRIGSRRVKGHELSGERPER
jgi:hypothetical protein